MSKKQNTRLYAIVGADDVAAIAALKDALVSYAPKYRDGKKLGFNDAKHVLFVEPRRQDEQVAGVIKRLVNRYKLFPCLLIEESRETQTSSGETNNGVQSSVAEIAVMNFAAPQGDFSRWQEIFRTIARGIYQDDGVSLSFNVYYRHQDGTVHAVCSGNRSVTEAASEDEQKLEEKKWKDAVCKMAVALGSVPQFRSVYCSCI